MKSNSLTSGRLPMPIRRYLAQDKRARGRSESRIIYSDSTCTVDALEPLERSAATFRRIANLVPGCDDEIRFADVIVMHSDSQGRGSDIKISYRSNRLLSDDSIRPLANEMMSVFEVPMFFARLAVLDKTTGDVKLDGTMVLDLPLARLARQFPNIDVPQKVLATMLIFKAYAKSQAVADQWTGWEDEGFSW